jgi:hypothetical protein
MPTEDIRMIPINLTAIRKKPTAINKCGEVPAERSKMTLFITIQHHNKNMF